MCLYINLHQTVNPEDRSHTVKLTSKGIQTGHKIPFIKKAL